MRAASDEKCGLADKISLHRVMLGLVCSGITLVTWNPGVMRSVPSDTIGVHGNVTSVPAGGLIRKPANFFDLEGTTVRFTPNEEGEYAVAVGDLDWREPGSGPETVSRVLGERDYLTVDLQFPFHFAGQTWTQVYANTNGNLSFQRPEQMNWLQRNPWPDATKRSVAAAIDSRSAAGLEAMIAVLWALYGDTTISVDSTSARTVITWQAVRPTPSNIHYEPLGENSFQVRLYPSGAIEFAYRAVAERDGIVGLFHGSNGRGRTLDTLDAAVGNVALGVLDITRIELIDNGSTLLARMTLAADVPELVAEGTIEYRIFLRFGDIECAVGISVSANGRAAFTWCGARPSVVGSRVHGATIEIPISKTVLNGRDHFSWAADAVWWGAHQYDSLSQHRTVHVGEPDFDLATVGTVAGNVFEVFHYPSIPKRGEEVMSFIYTRVPPNDEITVPFTDFRTDDLYSTGSGSGPINTPVHGIGEWQADPTPGQRFLSDNLLVTMVPLFLGAPNLAETGGSWDRPFRKFGYGVRWIAHEAVHRWVAHLQFRSPRSGHVEDLLANDGCRCHWSKYLHAPAVYPVWPTYSSEPYSEASIMGGAVWSDNGDGTFTREEDGNPLPTGLSALDLYAMGMISPSGVPETFILRDVQETDRRDTVRAARVPIRIEDIVSAMGPRVPAADASRKEFKLGIYLLHENGRPPRADLLERAKAVTAAISEYFARATGGRMQVIPTVAPTTNLRPVTVGRLAPLAIELDQGPVSVEVAGAFRDPDGDRLTYGATSSKPEVVSVSVSKSTVTVTAEAVGTAVVTVTATDIDGSNKTATQKFTVTVGGISSRLFVPIVLRSRGRTPGSLFTSELTLTNRGSTTANIHYTYRASSGGRSGTAVDSLEAGRQRVIPDAIAYLTSLGVAIGSGSAGGTLVAEFSNLSSPSDAAVTVRVATPVEDGSGRAGLAYSGLNLTQLLDGPAWLAGLRQNIQDRSNVAVQHAGDAGEGDITLRVTVFSGDLKAPGTSVVLENRILPPGGFHQYNKILKEAGFDNGYVKVERVAGTAPFYAYGVINDNFNSDGSFVFPVREDALVGRREQTLPVIIETGAFTSELTVTNFSPVAKTLNFRFVAEAVETDDDTASFSLTLQACEQRILPQIVDWLRRQEMEGIGPANRAFAGAVFATVGEGDMSGIVIGARTGAPDKRGGQYGLFYNGVPYGSASVESAWIYGLQQNAENRSNLALVNTGEVNDSSSTFEITIYDGGGESQPTTKSVTLEPGRWTQINGILGNIRQGYVQVQKTSGDNPFVAYGVINDGGRPGERSGDGAFLRNRE